MTNYVRILNVKYIRVLNKNYLILQITKIQKAIEE